MTAETPTNKIRQLTHATVGAAVLARSQGAPDPEFPGVLGVVALVVGNDAGIGRYSYDEDQDEDGRGFATVLFDGYDAPAPGDPAIPIVLDWTGTVDDLVAMAQRRADTYAPARRLADDDHHARYFDEVYASVLVWDAQGRRRDPQPS